MKQILPVKNQKAKRFKAEKIIESKNKTNTCYKIVNVGSKWIPNKVCRFIDKNKTLDIQEWYVRDIMKLPL